MAIRLPRAAAAVSFLIAGLMSLPGVSAAHPDVPREGARPEDLEPSDTIDIAVPSTGHGWWIAELDGEVVPSPWGDADAIGDVSHFRGEAVGIARTPSNAGYWLVSHLGEIHTVGDAQFHGQLDVIPNRPVVDIAATKSGNGYWMVAADGGVFAFGDARFYGSMGGVELNEPVVGMANAPQHDRYWLVAADGGIFTFGPDNRFFGSMGGTELNEPVVGMTSTETGHGYYLVARDGGVFSFGDATFHGSGVGDGRARGHFEAIGNAWDHEGYFLVTNHGDVLSYGEAGGVAAARSGCSAGEIAGEADVQRGLPGDVQRTRRAIIAAAVACDYEALGELARNGDRPFTYSFGDGGDPAERWRRLEAEGQGRKPLRYLVELLRRPHGQRTVEGLTTYQWPSAFTYDDWDDVPEADREALRPLYDEADFEFFERFGGYIGYRVGIAADGEWLFFVAGD